MSGLGFQIQSTHKMGHSHWMLDLTRGFISVYLPNSQKTSVRQALVELAVTARAVGRKELQEEIKTLLDVPRPEPRY